MERRKTNFVSNHLIARGFPKPGSDLPSRFRKHSTIGLLTSVPAGILAGFGSTG
jgi:hypothetical protein